MFKIGKHVKYMPPYKDMHDLAACAEESGLAPRKIYEIASMTDEGLVNVVGGGSAPISHFVAGELAYKLGKQDNSWNENGRKSTPESSPLEFSL
ncbi:hypothetical protein [Teredinibacter franksiae]|uniref:hypothetical protein n=1 Tax=Teredinibacter franksiae TaxID=2761453 RepID=UPI0016245DC9|nr:hypothetical protein [Teredinibacter franksiae]